MNPVIYGSLFVSVFFGFQAYGQDIEEDPLFDRKPYIQNLTATSVVVMSETIKPCRAILEYGESIPLQNVMQEEGENSRHVFPIGNLLPGTTYYYTLRYEGGENFLQAEFKTFPLERSGGEVILGVLGDSANPTGTSQADMARVLESIHPQAILHTGDISFVVGNPEGFQIFFFDVYASLLSKSCAFSVMGNHDVGWSLEYWREMFSFPQSPFYGLTYSYNAGDAHIVAMYSDSGGFSEEELAWVDEDLARDSHVWKILYFHKPPYSTIGHGSYPEVRKAITPIIDKHKVDLVLSGDNHGYERSYPIANGHVRDGFSEPEYVSPGGTIYIVTGGGGATLYDLLSAEEAKLSAKRVKAFNIVSLAISETGLRIDAIGRDGVPFDSCVIRKDGSVKNEFRFIRGDADQSGGINISDAVAILSFLFIGGAETCIAASDANASGSVAISDAVFLLSFLFLGGNPPSGPYPACGFVSGSQDYGCTYSCNE